MIHEFAFKGANIDRLPVSAWPQDVHDEEPVYGWISRLAKRNYAFSAGTFLQSHGLNQLERDYEDQIAFAGELPIPYLDALRHFTPLRVEGGVEFAGHLLSLRHIAKTQRRVCPVCLSESRHVRAWWDLVPVESCPDHNVQLIHGLEGDPINWRDLDIGRTRDGVLLDARNAVARQCSSLDRMLVERIRNCPNSSGAESFADEPLQAIIQAAVVVARMLTDDDKHFASIAFRRHEAQTGYAVVHGGRQKLVERLCEVEWLQSKADKSRYDARCHYLPEVIASIPSARLRGFVADALGEARVLNGVASPAGRLSKYDGADGCCSVKTVSERLGIERKYISRIIAGARISTKRCSRTRTHRIGQHAFDQIVTYVEVALSAQDVGDRLGCSSQDIDELVNRRMLQMDFRRHGERYFTPQAVEAFIGKSPRGSVRKLVCDGYSLRDFAAKSGTSLPVALSQLDRGKTIGVLAVDREVPFFDGVKVAYCEGTRIRPAAQVKDAITLARARARLAVSSRGLEEFIEGGFLRVKCRAGGRRNIDEASLKEFERKFAKASEYAVALGCPPRQAMKRLRACGVNSINTYGRKTVCYVSREDVLDQVGLQIEHSEIDEAFLTLRDDLQAALTRANVPATVRTTSRPVHVVEATSRRWGFDLLPLACGQRLQLKSRFRANKETRRLGRIQQLGLAAEQVWPGAMVEAQGGGGFELKEVVNLDGSQRGSEQSLADHVVRRALELHKLL